MAPDEPHTDLGPVLLNSALLCPLVSIFPHNRLKFTAKLLSVSVYQHAISMLKCWITAFDALISLFLTGATENTFSATDSYFHL